MAARGNGAAAGAALGNGGERIAMRMQLKPGMREEYRARHDAIWPELVALLREAGIGDYSIFLHEPTNSLFAVLTLSPAHSIGRLPAEAVMQRWWRHMADLMPHGPDGAPLSEALPCLFHMD